MPRRARHPVIVLTVLALVPAVALGGLTALARSKSSGVSVGVPDSTAAPSTPPVLSTPLMSVRRAPALLTADRRRDIVQQAMQPLAAAVDATSCLAVAVDDVLVAGTNTSLPVIPASNLKVVIAAAAIDVLGAGTTFTTKVVGPSPVDGVVHGDVYLVGGGDPVLSEPWYLQATATRKRPPINATDIGTLADALVAAGIRSIDGAVLGDGSRYDDERHPPGWSDSIRASYDGVPVGALVVNDSITQGGAINSDPAKSAATSFVRVLGEKGITVSGGAGTGTAPSDGVGVLGSINSGPLSAIVNEMLATSDNLTAEMMVKEIGLATSGRGTRVDGLQAVTDRLVNWGIASGSVTLVDGSGLSRENRVTCDALLAVLERSNATDPVGKGMAIAGQDGSTLDGKFEEPGLAGVLQAKTGSLRGVKALCGYFVTGGEEVEFVLILNGGSADGYAGPWSTLGQALLALAAAPGPDALGPVGAPPTTAPATADTGATSDTAAATQP